MSSGNRQQARKKLWDDNIAVGGVLETELADAQGKDVKTFFVVAAAGSGQVTVQFSADREEWYDHPSSENPAVFAIGVPVTLTVTDVMPFFRLKVEVTGGGTGNVLVYYISN